ncbi:hypothetical protein RND81_01G060100 [Saponaria officinalis]|uniref:Large ribosomal subunit protein bL21m n=1 Tax=Saponaria officinalis TaxID=3572 RepID=A0AAW1NCF3_SAPOF
MASKRCLTTLTRQFSTSLSLKSTNSHQFLKTLIFSIPSINNTTSKFHLYPHSSRFFSSKSPKNPEFTSTQIQSNDQNVADDDDDEEEEDDDDEDEEDYSSENEEEIDGNVGKRSVNEPSCFEERSYYVEEKLLEAADIGYKVVGPLKPDDRVFKHYESAFAVVQIGSHQFKVSNGDCIYVEKLKYCEVNDKVLLSGI